MSESSGMTLGSFQSQWFHREGVPVVRAEIAGNRVTLTQQDPWTLKVPIWQFVNGGWRVQHLELTGASASIDLPEDGPVLLDPERRVMAQISGAPAFPEELALAAYRASTSAAVRDELLNALRSASAVEILGLIEEEKVATMRQRLVNLLPRDDAALWLRLVDDEDRRIGNTAVQRLGSVPSSPEVLAKLRSVMRNDSNPRIRFSALSALYRLANDAALVEQAWTTDAPNEAFRTFALDTWQRTNPDRVRQLCLQTLRNSTNTILRIDATRRLGSLKDAPGSRDVYNALIEIVRDHGSNQPRIAAVNALVQYGDKAALPFLRPLANEGNTRFANAVRGPISRLERS
jgi:hypothetical protein